jgi:hypothetical protein
MNNKNKPTETDIETTLKLIEETKENWNKHAAKYTDLTLVGLLYQAKNLNVSQEGHLIDPKTNNILKRHALNLYTGWDNNKNPHLWHNIIDYPLATKFLTEELKQIEPIQNWIDPINFDGEKFNFILKNKQITLDEIQQTLKVEPLTLLINWRNTKTSHHFSNIENTYIECIQQLNNRGYELTPQKLEMLVMCEINHCGQEHDKRENDKLFGEFLKQLRKTKPQTIKEITNLILIERLAANGFAETLYQLTKHQTLPPIETSKYLQLALGGLDKNDKWEKFLTEVNKQYPIKNLQLEMQNKLIDQAISIKATKATKFLLTNNPEYKINMEQIKKIQENIKNSNYPQEKNF